MILCFVNYLMFFLLLVVTLLTGHLVSVEEGTWATHTLKQMSIDEKIGQLFMIAAYVDSEYAEREIGNAEIIQQIDHYIKDYYVGGLAYVGPSEYQKQITLTNHYQKISRYPLLIAQDLEWGLAMRLKDGQKFPKNITLAAIQDNALIYEMGKEIGRQAKLIGVQMNLSPVLDVNRDPNNIAINVRSFGENPKIVAEKGMAMIRGLQDAGIVASAKHFPGLGDISVDPHLGLPTNTRDKTHLQQVDLYPFIQAIKEGVLSIQTEHMVVPSLDSATPASLSSAIVNQLLKKELGFQGLVLSGALRMKALTLHFSDEEIILKAFLAGNDMLLMPKDLPGAYQTLKNALDQGIITEEEIDQRVLKILQVKERVKLNVNSQVAVPSFEELHSSFAKHLKQRLYQNAVHLLRDKQHQLPFSSADSNSVAYIQLGEPSQAVYFQNLSKVFRLEAIDALSSKLKDYAKIIVAIYPGDPRRIEQIRLLNPQQQEKALQEFKVHGLTPSMIEAIQNLQLYKDKIVVVYFGNPFGLQVIEAYPTVIMGYESDPHAQEAAVKITIQ